MFSRVAVFFLLSFLSAHAYTPPLVPAPHALRYPEDTFAFKNETVWNYVGGEVKPGPAKIEARQYTQRCFVLSRSIVQFWKFARFEPQQKPLSADQLARRIRRVTERSVWLPALAKKDRVIIPGYRNLREASAKMTYVFQKNLGLGWPFYFRLGNAVITFWVTRALEDRLNGEIWHDLHMRMPSILWIYRFPSLKMDHVIVVYSGTHDARGYHYNVYDPNYRDRFSHLDYDPATRTFRFEPVYYFKGGSVTARSIYRGLLN